jgi:hypothetical protein
LGVMRNVAWKFVSDPIYREIVSDPT